MNISNFITSCKFYCLPGIWIFSSFF